MDDRRFLELYALGLALEDPRRFFPAMEDAGASSGDIRDTEIKSAMESALSLYAKSGDTDVAKLGELPNGYVLYEAMEAMPREATSDEEMKALVVMLKDNSISNSGCGGGSRR